METFIGYVIDECVKAGITVHLYPTEYHDDCSGQFSDEREELMVATKRDDWIEVLAHEFGHFLQWQAGLWVEDEFFESDIFDDWLEGRVKLSHQKKTEMIKSFQECEMDAEKRAVGLFKRFELEVDIDRYIQKANAYVLFYAVLGKHRQWCDKVSPSRVDEILDLMPTTFVEDLTTLPTGFEELVLKHCFKSKGWWQRFKEWLH